MIRPLPQTNDVVDVGSPSRTPDHFFFVSANNGGDTLARAASTTGATSDLEISAPSLLDDRELC